MPPRKSSTANTKTPETERLLEPSLPAVLISPSKAAPNERDAYWIQLAADSQQFSEAIKTEEFYPLMAQLPEALWGETLRLYLYRKEDDSGLMLKNAPGEFKYVRVFYKPVEQQWIADNYGGGKYEWRLNWIKEKANVTIKRYTFEIYGPPKMQEGQIVEVKGKPVPVGSAPAAPAPSVEHSDMAKVIDANAAANEKITSMVVEGAKATIQMVKEQAATVAAPPTESPVIAKLLEIAIARMMQPPPDFFEMFLKYQGALQKANPQPEPVEPKDPPLTQAMELAEKITGKDFSELIRGHKSSAATDATPSWLPLALGMVEKVCQIAPQIMEQSRIARMEEFRRQVWLKQNQTPGSNPPKELLEVNPSQQPAPAAAPANPPQQPQATHQQSGNGAPDMNQIVNAIVGTICQGFDRSPRMGFDVAAALNVNYGHYIDALGLEAVLADKSQISEFVAGHPELAQRAQFPTWKQFQEDFLGYWTGGEEEQEGEEEPKIGPQPVA